MKVGKNIEDVVSFKSRFYNADIIKLIENKKLRVDSDTQERLTTWHKEYIKQNYKKGTLGDLDKGVAIEDCTKVSPYILSYKNSRTFIELDTKNNNSSFKKDIDMKVSDLNNEYFSEPQSLEKIDSSKYTIQDKFYVSEHKDGEVDFFVSITSGNRITNGGTLNFEDNRLATGSVVLNTKDKATELYTTPAEVEYLERSDNQELFALKQDKSILYNNVVSREMVDLNSSFLESERGKDVMSNYLQNIRNEYETKYPKHEDFNEREKIIAVQTFLNNEKNQEKIRDFREEYDNEFFKYREKELSYIMNESNAYNEVVTKMFKSQGYSERDIHAISFYERNKEEIMESLTSGESSIEGKTMTDLRHMKGLHSSFRDTIQNDDGAVIHPEIESFVNDYGDIQTIVAYVDKNKERFPSFQGENTMSEELLFKNRGMIDEYQTELLFYRGKETIKETSVEMYGKLLENYYSKEEINNFKGLDEINKEISTIYSKNLELLSEKGQLDKNQVVTLSRGDQFTFERNSEKILLLNSLSKYTPEYLEDKHSENRFTVNLDGEPIKSNMRINQTDLEKIKDLYQSNLLENQKNKNVVDIHKETIIKEFEGNQRRKLEANKEVFRSDLVNNQEFIDETKQLFLKEVSVSDAFEEIHEAKYLKEHGNLDGFEDYLKKENNNAFLNNNKVEFIKKNTDTLVNLDEYKSEFKELQQKRVFLKNPPEMTDKDIKQLGEREFDRKVFFDSFISKDGLEDNHYNRELVHQKFLTLEKENPEEIKERVEEHLLNNDYKKELMEKYDNLESSKENNEEVMKFLNYNEFKEFREKELKNLDNEIKDQRKIIQENFEKIRELDLKNGESKELQGIFKEINSSHEEINKATQKMDLITEINDKQKVSFFQASESDKSGKLEIPEDRIVSDQEYMKIYNKYKTIAEDFRDKVQTLETSKTLLMEDPSNRALQTDVLKLEKEVQERAGEHYKFANYLEDSKSKEKEDVIREILSKDKNEYEIEPNDKIATFIQANQDLRENLDDKTLKKVTLDHRNNEYKLINQEVDTTAKISIIHKEYIDNKTSVESNLLNKELKDVEISKENKDLIDKFTSGYDIDKDTLTVNTVKERHLNNLEDEKVKSDILNDKVFKIFEDKQLIKIDDLGKLGTEIKVDHEIYKENKAEIKEFSNYVNELVDKVSSENAYKSGPQSFVYAMNQKDFQELEKRIERMEEIGALSLKEEDKEFLNSAKTIKGSPEKEYEDKETASGKDIDKIENEIKEKTEEEEENENDELIK